MGLYFSDDVEQALADIYYNVRFKTANGPRGFETLQRAADNGDPDAMYFLSRCYGGKSYVWSDFGFPEDDDMMFEWVGRSMQAGSAVGVVGSLRVGMSSELENSPFNSLHEAWEVVLAKAQAGETFCQYMIGNTYKWGDIADIEERTPDKFLDTDQFMAYLADSTLKCVPWFEKAMEQGAWAAAQGLVTLYRKGAENHIAPQPQKAESALKRAIELGYPEFAWQYGDMLFEQERYREAVYYIDWSRREGNAYDTYDNDELAYCKINGLGCRQDYEGAKALLDEVSWGSPLKNFCYGKIYAEGLGVPQDIAKGVSYYQKADSLPQTRQELARYRKTFFGKWVMKY